MAIAPRKTREAGHLSSVGFSFGLIFWLAAAPPSHATCEFFSAPQRFNTQTNGDTIVIGAQPDRRYRVVLARQDETALAEIRACIPDAFATRSSFGPYIQIGSFDNRRDAEIIRRILSKEGYQVRVTYIR